MINGKFSIDLLCIWDEGRKKSNLQTCCYDVPFFFFFCTFIVIHFYQNGCFSRYSIMAFVVVVFVVLGTITTTTTSTAYGADAAAADGCLSVCINVWYVNGIYAWAKLWICFYLMRTRISNGIETRKFIYLDKFCICQEKFIFKIDVTILFCFGNGFWWDAWVSLSHSLNRRVFFHLTYSCLENTFKNYERVRNHLYFIVSAVFTKLIKNDVHKQKRDMSFENRGAHEAFFGYQICRRTLWISCKRERCLNRWNCFVRMIC